ncbi:MAG: tRNA pseudouridine(55) synthase TruB [Bacteroidales bacterium]|nr:tRNA pseudouridine(55) synthase TruB [Bacteroidales bacterium]
MFELGQVVVFDKPLTWTSFDMVNKVRYLLRHYRGLRKIKVGHAGTLDPLASGVLIVCTGKKTKEITTYQDHDKEYIATVRLGSTTPSFDLETEPENFVDASHISRDMVEECVKTFIGVQQQYPPVYSAKKINGERAFVAAHEGRGDEVKMRPQMIEIMDIEITEFNNDSKEFKARVHCSKGTYIRSLAHDIGKKLGVGGHLAGLRRTRIGDVRIENAISMEDFEKKLQLSQK